MSLMKATGSDGTGARRNRSAAVPVEPSIRPKALCSAAIADDFFRVKPKGQPARSGRYSMIAVTQIMLAVLHMSYINVIR